MVKLLDLRYLSQEHLAHDLQTLQLRPKQYHAALSCLRHYTGARIIVKWRKRSSTLYIDIIDKSLTLRTSVSVAGVRPPIQYV